MSNVYKSLNEKPEGKRALGRPRRRWNVNTKMDLRKKVGKVRSAFMWLRIGTILGLL
jgi:hypothetical protein